MSRRRRHTTRAGNPLLDGPPATPVRIVPTITTLAAGTRLIRIYFPHAHGGSAVGFRTHGPHARFDHHRPAADGRPTDDPQRGVLYAGADLVCALGEVFADAFGVIDTAGAMVAGVDLEVDLHLLELRGTAALGVGTTPAIAGISQRRTTQQWARHLYEHPQVLGVHGFAYAAANTGRGAYVLFERATTSLRVVVDLRLDDPVLRAELDQAAYELHMAIL